eukprot:2497624-Rhodomonas_salina.1
MELLAASPDLAQFKVRSWPARARICAQKRTVVLGTVLREHGCPKLYLLPGADGAPFGTRSRSAEPGGSWSRGRGASKRTGWAGLGRSAPSTLPCTRSELRSHLRSNSARTPLELRSNSARTPLDLR